MKPLQLIKTILFFFLLLSEAKTEPFNGPYLGGHSSWIQREDLTYSPTIQIEYQAAICNVGEIKSSQKELYATYGVLAGVGKRFVNGLYLGTELAFETHNVTTDTVSYPYLTLSVCREALPTSGMDSPIPPSEGPATLPGVAPSVPSPSEPLSHQAFLKTRYERGRVLAFSCRVGIVLEKDTLVYVKASLEQSKDTLTSSYLVELGDHTHIQTTTVSRNQLVVVPGLGIEKSFGRFHGRCEYHYNPGAFFKTQSKLLEHNLTQKNAYKAHVLKWAILYHF